jgi:hypothetical protein
MYYKRVSCQCKRTTNPEMADLDFADTLADPSQNQKSGIFTNSTGNIK